MKTKIVNLIFYLSILLSLIILTLPVKFRIAIYTPSILGFIWLLSFPIIVGSYIWLTFINLKNENKRDLIRMSFILTGFIVLSIIIWLYQAKKNGNI